MAGYAARKSNPSEGTEGDLFVTTLALEDREGRRAVLVTSDLIGINAALRAAVESALEINEKTTHHQHPLDGPLRTALETVELEFRTGREAFAHPVQLVQFGDDLALVALGSEVVVDYSLRLKKELAGRGPAIWVAGYSNVYDGYVPSARVLLEGGYEAASRPWKPELEERIVGKVHTLFDRFNP